MAGEIIRQGDPTSHGGTVLEGSTSDICMGKPIAYIGHKVQCPLCKGAFPIIEGVLTTTFYGKGVAVAGMKTACGATLIPTQFTDTVEWSSGASRSSAAKAVAAKAVAALAVAAGVRSVRPDGVSLDPFDEQSQLPRLVSDGVPYLIIMPDGQKLSGRADSSGKLPRVVTDDEAEYEVFWGDEALSRMGA